MRVKMNPWCKERAGNFIVIVLRAALLYPSIILLDTAQSHWNLIKHHSELHSGIYNSAIANGEMLSYKWAQIGFYWNVAVWVPTTFVPAPFIILLGFIDAAVAAMILRFPVHVSYIPHNVNQCRGTGAHDWQLPPGANESFFETSARLNSTTTTPFQICASYVEEREMGFIVLVLISLIASINVVYCVYTCIYQSREFQPEDISYPRRLLNAFISGLESVVHLIDILIFGPLQQLFRCLPLSFKARTRYARRYTMKAGRGAMHGGEVQLRKISARVMGKGEAQDSYRGGVEGEPTKLADFLSIYDMLILVIENLHHADIVNLSLASKSVRESVLPAQDYDRRMQLFKMYTCEKDSKAQCWVCSNQVCKSCTYDHTLQQTFLYHHLDLCNPTCSPCYYALQKQRPDWNGRVCRCVPRTGIPNIIQFYRRIRQDYTPEGHGLDKVVRRVCKQCTALSEDEVERVRRRRTEVELRRGKREGRGKCGKCERTLARGPRWWICWKCEMDCTSFCHDAWGKREKEAAIVEGQEVV